MKYKQIKKGTFLARPNRFMAQVEIDGVVHSVHVKNTGRCKELLIGGVTVYLEDFEEDMRQRKTRFSLVAVEKIRETGEKLLVNMDSQAPNKAVAEALKDGTIVLPGMNGRLRTILPEKTFGASRFDFYAEAIEEPQRNGGCCHKKAAYIEVKGVTLEDHGLAKFPDAPTLRGVKHIEHLMKAHREGFQAYIIFVIQMQTIHTFTPNYVMHPQFGDALKGAKKAGVHILAYDCAITPNSMKIGVEVPIVL
ncbi:MAG: DNA/RNA nuclease SfsA [Anaerovorax sp.]